MAMRLIRLALLLLVPVTSFAAVPVSVAPLASQLIDVSLRAPATVVAANRSVLSAQVTAPVAEILADVGATVERGDVLIRLDDRDARLALDRARAELEAIDAQIVQARRRLKRGQDLVESNFISDDELLERETAVIVLEANRKAQVQAVQIAELAFSRTRIRAPFAAAVVERMAQTGSLAQPGTPLITVVQIDQREVEADVDPRYASDLSRGSDLRFVAQGRSWPLAVARISPVVEREARIQRVRLVFSDETARIGLGGEIAWRDATGLVPVPLIVQRDGKLGVFVADGSTARFVALPEAQEGRPARASLPPDTRIVVRGQSRLQDGDALEISAL